MKYTNILEKILCVFNLIKTDWASISFLIVVTLLLILLGCKKISKKATTITILISYISFLGYTIFTYNKELGAIGDNLMDNLFTNIYFPSTYTYLFVLIIIDIVTITSFLNNKRSNVYKWVHGICFLLIQFILVLILELLSKSKIDLFSKTSLFSSKDLVMLLELSINIFITWIIVNIFIYITNLITEKITLSSIQPSHSKEKNDTPVNMNNLVVDIDTSNSLTVEQPENNFIPNESLIENNQVLETNINIPNETLINNNQVLETTIPNTNTNETVNILTNHINSNILEPTPVPEVRNTTNVNLEDLIPKNRENIIPQTTPSNTIFEHILNNNLPYIKEETTKEEHKETDNYTLNDYRIFNKMLKEIKEYNQNNTVTIDKNLEYRLITKYSTETFNMFKQMLKIYSH